MGRLTTFFVALSCLAGVGGSSARVGHSAELEPALAERVRARLADGVIRWGGDDEGGAPYQFRDPNEPDKVVGFEVDVMDAVARRLGERLATPIRAEFVKYEWVSLPQGLAKRDFDLIASGMEMTAENRAKMLFSRPYYIYSQQLVVRADETRVKSLRLPAAFGGHALAIGGRADSRGARDCEDSVVRGPDRAVSRFGTGPDRRRAA
jgi:ABC-type amino acid transport substrate-binding protein